MTRRQAVQTVWSMALQDVRFKKRVVTHSAHADPVIGENVHLVLDVMPDLKPGWVLQPGFEPSQCCSKGKLLRRAGIAMRERDINGVVRFSRERYANELGCHRIDAGRCDIHGGKLGVDNAR